MVFNFISWRSWVVFLGVEIILAGVLVVLAAFNGFILIAVGVILLTVLWIWENRRSQLRSGLQRLKSPSRWLNGLSVARQKDIALSLANDDDHVHKRIRDGGASHAIRAKVTTRPYLREVLAIVQDISRWQAGLWHTLNSRNRMPLNPVGRGDESYRPVSFAGTNYFVVLNYYESGGRLELPTDATLPSFVERKNLPHGRYKLEIEVEYDGGIACCGAFIVDWFGSIETMRIERQNAC